jgi:hypothetical protein
MCFRIYQASINITDGGTYYTISPESASADGHRQPATLPLDLLDSNDMYRSLVALLSMTGSIVLGTGWTGVQNGSKNSR